MKQSGDSIDCSFSISWTHRLRFTTNAFIGGGVLTDVINELNPLKLLVVIDNGIVDSNSEIMNSIEQWSSTIGSDCGTPIQVTGGEDAKNDCIVVDSVLAAIDSGNLCRKSAVLAIGGGAVLDAVGYAASIAHRGIQLVRMPSTTLSQCDSGVGVKNGVMAGIHQEREIAWFLCFVTLAVGTVCVMSLIPVEAKRVANQN